MDSYPVKIFKTIWAEEPPESGSFSDAVGFMPEYMKVGYALKLPFPPFKGLIISNNTDDHQFICEPIIEVNWQHDAKTFICLVPDEQPYSEEGYDYSFDWLIETALNEQGWKKIKQHP